MSKARAVTPFFLVLLLLLGACATGGMNRLMPKITTMYVAQRYFGPPKASTEQADGTVRHDWAMDRTMTLPGHYETRCVWVYHDRDGYRECIEREVWVPARTERQTCRLTIIADKEGAVLHSSWEGNRCEQMTTLQPTY